MAINNKKPIKTIMYIAHSHYEATKAVIHSVISNINKNRGPNKMIATLLLCLSVLIIVLDPPVIQAQQLYHHRRPKFLPSSSIQLTPTKEDTVAPVAATAALHTENPDPETLNSRKRTSSPYSEDAMHGGDAAMHSKNSDNIQFILKKPVDDDDDDGGDDNTMVAASAHHQFNNKKTHHDNNVAEKENDHAVENKIAHIAANSNNEHHNHGINRLAQHNTKEHESRQMSPSLSDRIFGSLLANNRIVNLSHSMTPIQVNADMSLPILHYPFVTLNERPATDKAASVTQPSKIYGDGTESKFPPILEHFVQRIQHYFSVYKYEDLSRPALHAEVTEKFEENEMISSQTEDYPIGDLITESLEQVYVEEPTSGLFDNGFGEVENRTSEISQLLTTMLPNGNSWVTESVFNDTADNETSEIPTTVDSIANYIYVGENDVDDDAPSG